ncbi:MAG: 4'-phosphopantetheinyl transferase superfamily protein, partial [Bacteroidia bacterium]|nr:4'-phosphopantetheinyl transferase superfamily protein [Bacteroidia bacterium]
MQIEFQHTHSHFTILILSIPKDKHLLSPSRQSLYFKNFLSNYLSKNLNAQIYYLSSGKPMIHCNSYKSISISHTQQFLAIQLHKEEIAGIDIETQRTSLIKIQSKFLNNKEIKWANNDLFNLSVLWTAKEALYKIIGTSGISLKEHIFVDASNYPNITGTILYQHQTHPFLLYSQKYKDLTLTYV